MEPCGEVFVLKVDAARGRQVGRGQGVGGCRITHRPGSSGHLSSPCGYSAPFALSHC